MQLYSYMQPQVVKQLKEAASKIYISFNRWTTKGGKRGFFSVVAYYAITYRVVKDVTINLPQLTGAYTGDRIANDIKKTLREFGITAPKLSYFILNNAYNNDAAIKKLSSKYGFIASYRRLRCAAYTINLVS
ncbi:hypothetical protein Ptr902_03747 [Pyrenophora tritici-repentis]|nr:hypothetical protein Ptr902_03747 [Pyrenophora tritici-repentis]